jgi:hypothetical protein
VHAGILAQLRLHFVSAKPWQRALVALGLLAVGVAAGLLAFDVVGGVLFVATTIGWWRARHGAVPQEQRPEEQ